MPSRLGAEAPQHHTHSTTPTDSQGRAALAGNSSYRRHKNGTCGRDRPRYHQLGSRRPRGRRLPSWWYRGRSLPHVPFLCLLYDELPASAARPCESVGVVLWVVLWCFGAQSARHRPELSSRRYANLRLLDSTYVRRRLFPGVVPGEPALALPYPAQYLAAHGTRRAQAAPGAPPGSRAGDRSGCHAHRRLADTGSGLGRRGDSAVELWAMAPVGEAAGHPDRPRGSRYGAAAWRRGHGATVGAHDPRPALHPHWTGRDGRLPAQPGAWPSGPRTPQGHLAPGPTGSFVGATGGRAPAVSYTHLTLPT